MAHTHTLLTPTVIAKEALMQLENNMVMGNLVHRGYVTEFAKEGAKIGTSVTIRKPNKFKVTKSRVRVTHMLTEQSITLTVATQAHVSWVFTTAQLTMTIDEYSKRYIQPACAALANQVDLDLCSLYDDVWNQVHESTGFVTPESFIVLGKAAQLMDEEAVPAEERCVVLNPAANWSLANAMKSLYVTDVSKPALKKGFLARIANFEIYMDQNIRAHTTGQYHDTGSDPGIQHQTAAGTANATAIIACNFKWTGSADLLKTGDVFTISGVYAVNPISGESTGQLRKFVVTANVTSMETVSTAGTVAVHIDPPLIHTGPYKTIDTVPASQATINVIGNECEPYPQNLAFHKNAFALVTVPLEMPDGAWGARESHNGLNIRVVKDYDIDADYEVCRLDILYGVKTLYPELACRIYGAEG